MALYTKAHYNTCVHLMVMMMEIGVLRFDDLSNVWNDIHHGGRTANCKFALNEREMDRIIFKCYQSTTLVIDIVWLEMRTV